MTKCNWFSYCNGLHVVVCGLIIKMHTFHIPSACLNTLLECIQLRLNLDVLSNMLT